MATIYTGTKVSNLDQISNVNNNDYLLITRPIDKNYISKKISYEDFEKQQIIDIKVNVLSDLIMNSFLDSVSYKNHVLMFKFLNKDEIYNTVSVEISDYMSPYQVTDGLCVMNSSMLSIDYEKIKYGTISTNIHLSDYMLKCDLSSLSSCNCNISSLVLSNYTYIKNLSAEVISNFNAVNSNISSMSSFISNDILSNLSSIDNDISYMSTYIDNGLCTFITSNDNYLCMSILSLSSSIPSIEDISNLLDLSNFISLTPNLSLVNGYKCIAPGNFAQAQGLYTSAFGNYSHAEGDYSVTKDYGTHAEGCCTSAVGVHSHSEGNKTQSYGDSAHAEGDETLAYGDVSHAEGYSTVSKARGSHAEGIMTETRGKYSHVEGVSADIKFRHDYAYCYNGDDKVKYSSNGEGTFNINPKGGLSGLYIGTSSFYDIVDFIVQQKLNSILCVDNRLSA